MEGGLEHGKPGLVTMPRRGERTGPAWRRVGVQEYADAGVRGIENLEAGASIEEIIEQFDITREEINAVLEFAARSSEAPVPCPTVPAL